MIWSLQLLIQNGISLIRGKYFGLQTLFEKNLDIGVIESGPFDSSFSLRAAQSPIFQNFLSPKVVPFWSL